MPAVDRALEEAGFIVRHVQVSTGFAAADRGEPRRQHGADARLFPAEPGKPAPMLSGEELAVDKVLALFGRAEARDFVDLAAIEPRYGLGRLFELAAEKDHGFTFEMFAEMAGRFSRLRPDEFGVGQAAYEELKRNVLEWQERARDE